MNLTVESCTISVMENENDKVNLEDIAEDLMYANRADVFSLKIPAGDINRFNEIMGGLDLKRKDSIQEIINGKYKTIYSSTTHPNLIVGEGFRDGVYESRVLLILDNHQINLLKRR